MSKIDKNKTILMDLLKIRKNVDIDEVVHLLNISESTARRLFVIMQNEGLVIRTHGGVQIAQSNVHEYLYEDFVNEQIVEKEYVADLAAKLISDHDVIFLEAGTTIMKLCHKIADRIRNGALNDITVFTNSIVTLEILHSVCKVILIGGEYRHKRRDLTGFVSEKTIMNFRFNQCFVGADGVDLQEGFMTTDIDTAHLDALIISRSEKPIIVLDSAKFSKRSLITFASFADIDSIVTNSDVHEDIIRTLEAHGVKVINE